MKVYLIWYADHFDESNIQVLEVFSTKDKARKYLNELNDSDCYIEERSVK